MIIGKYARIRTADVDDAPALHACYRIEGPCAALLDVKRERLEPTQDELRETLGRAETARGLFYAVEDLSGVVQAFCLLRRAQQAEARFGELALLCPGPEILLQPLGESVMEFLRDRAFRLLALHKVTAQVFLEEEAMRGFFFRHGFVTQGVQREVHFAGGRWHDLEALALWAETEAA